jgi:hypothetical protein
MDYTSNSDKIYLFNILRTLKMPKHPRFKIDNSFTCERKYRFLNSFGWQSIIDLNPYDLEDCVSIAYSWFMFTGLKSSNNSEANYDLTKACNADDWNKLLLLFRDVKEKVKEKEYIFGKDYDGWAVKSGNYYNLCLSKTYPGSPEWFRFKFQNNKIIKVD